jgi:hypothetical protein
MICPQYKAAIIRSITSHKEYHPREMFYQLTDRAIVDMMQCDKEYCSDWDRVNKKCRRG